MFPGLCCLVAVVRMRSPWLPEFLVVGSESYCEDSGEPPLLCLGFGCRISFLVCVLVEFASLASVVLGRSPDPVWMWVCTEHCVVAGTGRSYLRSLPNSSHDGPGWSGMVLGPFVPRFVVVDWLGVTPVVQD